MIKDTYHFLNHSQVARDREPPDREPFPPPPSPPQPSPSYPPTKGWPPGDTGDRGGHKPPGIEPSTPWGQPWDDEDE